MAFVDSPEGGELLHATSTQAKADPGDSLSRSGRGTEELSGLRRELS